MELTSHVPCGHGKGLENKTLSLVWGSGGAWVFAAQGKRLCCRPANQISSAIGVFLGFRT